MLIVESQSLDIYRNLAIEEYLMDHVSCSGPILFLWRSACAVVIGKNQNPWKECRLELMEKEGVPLARRISGGGTVYHDAGNLNYCVITAREMYREEQAYTLILEVLRGFGISAEKTGQSNLSRDGLKFSGNAFAFRKGRVLHHGTLLLHTDLERLGRYLGPMIGEIDTHAIASVPARVMNLDLEVSAVIDALKSVFKELYGGGPVFQWTEDQLDAALVTSLIKHQKSDIWRYDATPKFSLSVDGDLIEVFRGQIVGGRYEGKSFQEVVFSLVC